MDTFNAGVQYNDFKGTVAADISDNVALADYLVSLGKAESDERVVGFRIASGENRGTPVTDVSLVARSEEHTSELQSLMRISYAVFCLKKKNNTSLRH